MAKIYKNSAYRRRIRAKLFIEQRGVCWICHEEMSLDAPGSGDYATFDHVQARTLGGSNAQSNLRLAHQR